MPSVQFLPSGKSVQRAATIRAAGCGPAGRGGDRVSVRRRGNLRQMHRPRHQRRGGFPQPGHAAPGRGRRRLRPGLRDAAARHGSDGRSPRAGRAGRRQIRARKRSPPGAARVAAPAMGVRSAGRQVAAAGGAAATGKRAVGPRPPHARDSTRLGQTARRLLPPRPPQSGRHAARGPGTGDSDHRARLRTATCHQHRARRHHPPALCRRH